MTEVNDIVHWLRHGPMKDKENRRRGCGQTVTIEESEAIFVIYRAITKHPPASPPTTCAPRIRRRVSSRVVLILLSRLLDIQSTPSLLDSAPIWTALSEICGSNNQHRV
jgi:hypothetical protein